MFRTFLMLCVAASCFFAVRPLAAQEPPSMPLRVYYVKRSATHITSGGTYTQTHGPYATYAQALQVKQQLDSVRYSGTWGYGLAYIESHINPAIAMAHENLARRSNPNLKYLKKKTKTKRTKSS